MSALDTILAEIDAKTAARIREAVELCAVPCPKCGAGRGKFCGPNGRVCVERVISK